ncbi:LOW QUALITY PROTEIN: protein MTSS 1-like [Alosa alosa]|uniref:LOW QUALITY PROTEIN: protein MTSS 1-like n=1 Tax=Alosa alosa TaxID=278164 RepID=UPI002015196E|nr:LOW QUALITY PROTEIN: protein MTSS 1-like [Alosa alosa]
MEAVIEKECSALGGLFQTIIGDMKSSYPVWEDFISKASKLQSQLRTTVVATAAFLDAFQKVADLATSSRGSTRDIGSALTRMCMRHRSIEARLRQLSMALIDCLINPLQDHIEDWKKGANTLDKDHAKEYKKARQEIKKKSSDTLKLQKKAKKGRGDVQPQLDCAMQDVSDKYLLLEETEKQAVRRALIEERARFCSFVSMLRPVLDEEVSMLGEITHLQTIADDLKSLTIDPHKLPAASEQVIHDLKGSDYNWTYQTPPSSPSNAVSRKSSMCSGSLTSVTSSDSRSSGSYSHSPTSTPHYRYRSCTLPPHSSNRLASISSHDSGFISQDAGQSKSPSPMPADTGTQDWAKPGPYDQPMVNTLRKKKESGSVSMSMEPPPAPAQPALPSSHSTDQPPRVCRMLAMPKPAEDPDPHAELALALSCGLQLDAHAQGSSRDSLQCSSGYSTQTNTPCCSEDTIPSQMSDYDYFSMGGEPEVDQQDFDKSSTIPRNSDITQSYRRMFQTKRPASTAGVPSGPVPVIVTPGTATIRRTPSTKPSGRRATISGGGPIPIKTPVIPLRTPAAPDALPSLCFGQGGCVASEEEEEDEDPPSPESPASGEGEQLGLLPVSSWSGQASTNPPVPVAQTGKGSDGLLDGMDPADPQGDTMLLAIQRGVKLKKTPMTSDRSAPRIA